MSRRVQEIDAKQGEHIEKAIMQTLDRYFEAARQRDHRRFICFLVDTNEMSTIENEEIRPSRKVFEEWITGFSKGIARLNAVAEERRVFPLSPEVAVATGVPRYSAETTSGEVVGGRSAFTSSLSRRLCQEGRASANQQCYESSLPDKTEA